MELLLLLAVVGGAVYLISTRVGGGSRKQLEQEQLDDALADAKRWTDRLGSQVLNLPGSDTASSQAMADASERFTAASAALADAPSSRRTSLANPPSRACTTSTPPARSWACPLARRCRSSRASAAPAA